MSTTLGTIRNDWKKEGTTTQASFGSGYLETGSEPTTSTGSGIYLLGLNTPFSVGSDFNNVSALFYGTGSAGNTAQARIWGVSKVNGVSTYTGVLLGELTVTCGAQTLYSSYKNIKSIAVDSDSSNLPPGIRIIGENGDRSASLLIDAMGFQFIVLELIKGTFTNIGVVWRVL